MTCEELIKKLFENQDSSYRDFHSALLPNIAKETLIGVRVPVMRKLAKEFFKTADDAELNRFFDKLPHRYFEENQIHLFMVAQIKNFDECLFRLEQFLPYIDNWAVCDGKSPKSLLKELPRYEEKIHKWLQNSHPYVVRFGVNILMESFLDERFDAKHLDWVLAIDENTFSDDVPQVSNHSKAQRPTDRYYVQMVVAWYLATALAKQWDATFPYIQKQKFSPWIHNKAIQKSKESFRITSEQKEILSKFKV